MYREKPAVKPDKRAKIRDAFDGDELVSNQATIREAMRMGKSKLLRGDSQSPSPKYIRSLRPPRIPNNTNSRPKSLVTISFFLVVSFLFLSPFFGAVGDEPDIVDQGSQEFTATWTFDNPSDFTTKETIISNSEVVLETHQYFWNQTTQNDFNSAVQKDNVTITQKTYTDEVWSDDFERIDEGDWILGILGGGKNQWQHGEVSDIPGFIGPRNSGNYVWGTNLSGKYDDDNAVPSDYFLMSPAIDLGDSVNTKMTLWHYYSFENETIWSDGGRVEVSIDNGLSWIPKFNLGSFMDKIESTANPLYDDYCFVGNSSDWIEETYDLSTLDGEDSLLIRFRFATDGLVSDYGWYLDEIKITSTRFSDGEVELSTRNMEVGNDPVNIVQRPTGITIIDTTKPVNVDGLITEWTVYTATSGKGKMKIFRKIGGDFRYMDETELEDIGVNNTFECSIQVKEGDYIGWYGESAEIYATSNGGSSYSMSDDIKLTHPISDWTSNNDTYSISARGVSRFPVGIITSSVFDTGSSAMWNEISWSGDISPPKVAIQFQTRTGNSSDTSHASWSAWSSYLSNSGGSTINNPDSQFIQYKVRLTSMEQPNTPTLRDVAISFDKFSPLGEIETNDLIPDIIVQWQDFEFEETLNGQHIDYYYSLDSGGTWDPVPESGDLSSVSVLEGKIRFKSNLITTDTTVSPKLGEISLSYSSATPDMTFSIQADLEDVKPGDTLPISIFYQNNGVGAAKDVDITLELGTNLTFKGDNSGVQSTIEGETKRRWHFETVETGNWSFIVDTKVKDISKDTTLSISGTLEYTDIGGNQYNEMDSNILTIKVVETQDLFTYYLSIGGIIAAILIFSGIIIYRRYKAMQAGEVKMGPDDVKPGIGYLVMEENPSISYGIFSELIDEGYDGLCITRTFPSRVKATYYFEGVSMLWLSRARDELSILPTNLGGVLNRVKDFMDQNEKPVILLDGLEYLMVHNDFERVLKLVHGLNELTAIYNAMFIMPFNPLTMDVDKVALLKRDLKVLG